MTDIPHGQTMGSLKPHPKQSATKPFRRPLRMIHIPFVCGLIIWQAGHVFAVTALSIFKFEIAPEGNRLFSFQAETNAYYILYRGSEAGLIQQPVSMVAPGSGTAQLQDIERMGASGFYRVAAIPVTLPLDSDSDGIDDLTEWRVKLCLDPFNSADAAGDCDGDGRSNLQEHQAATDPTAAEGSQAIVINEVDYDQAGTDNAEFVELLNVSANTINLTNLALIFMDGARNSEYRRVDLDGTLSPGEYLVIGSSNVVANAGARIIRFRQSANTIQNGGPDGLALVNTISHQILDALSYEGAITAGAIDGLPGTYPFIESNPLPVPIADSNTITGSLIRYPNGTDTQNSAADWKFTTTLTPGAANLLP